MGKKLTRVVDALNAIHNTTPEGIRAAKRMGGIPAPSHAVVPEGHPFQSYGDISLVGGADMVDPRRGHAMFNADVYSRRQPKPLYRARKSIESPEAKMVLDATEEIKDSARWEIGDWLRSGDPKEIRASNSAGFLLAYARANDVDIPLPDNPLSTNEIIDLGQQQRAVRSKIKDALDAGEDVSSPTVQALDDEFVSLQKKLDAGNTPSAYDIRKRLEDAGVDPYGAESWLSDSLIRHGDWDRPYFERGGKKVDYTADNLADYMNARTRGQEQTFVEGLGKQRSKSAKKYKSIEQARKDADSIVDGDTFSAFRDETNELLAQIADKVQSPYSSQFQIMDDVSNAVGDVMKGTSPQAALRRYDLTGDVDDELFALAEMVKNGPTEYFESKFSGVAGLDDYLGAVVPENAPQDVVNILTDAGLQVERYVDGADMPAARSRIQDSAFGVAPVSVAVNDFVQRRAEQGSKIALDALEAAATIGSAVVGGYLSDASQLSNYLLNYSMTPEEIQSASERLGERVTYMPNPDNELLGPIAEWLRQASDTIDSYMPDQQSIDESIPGQMYNALPERAQGVVRSAYNLLPTPL